MATVYLARDLRHDRRVALKVLDPELGAVIGPDRFTSEIRVTAHLQHPNLLPLFDSGQAVGLLFYVMPYIEGETLRHRLDREKQLSIDEAVRLTTTMCSALDYAHRNGVVHRDLKPANILLHDGQPIIADFGIALAISNAGGARLTQTGITLGTPQYMAPEQAAGDRVSDPRVDIYAVGAVLYEMLAGEPPHTGATSQTIIAKVLTEEPRPITSLRRSVPAHIERAVHRALQKVPADRFATARELAEALNAKAAIPALERNHSRSLMYWRSAAAGMMVIAAAAIAWAAVRPSAPADLPMRVPLGLPDTAALDSPAGERSFDLSPDGARVVYMADDGLFIRQINDL